MSNSRSSVACLIPLLALTASLAHGQAAQPTGNSRENQALSAVSTSQPKAMAENSENPPKVICKGDELTISANNSTLASILAEVQKCIGKPISIPAGAGDNRFFDTIGPGPIRTVLASLLNGTGFNFVIGSPDSDPQNVQTVVLMARADDATTDAVADRALTPARRAYLQMLQNSKTEGQSHNDSSTETLPDTENKVGDQSPAQQPENSATNLSPGSPTDQSVATPATETPPSSTAPDASASAAAPDPAPKTVDDQITNMEQMFEQRRQMMRNSTPPPQ